MVQDKNFGNSDRSMNEQELKLFCDYFSIEPQTLLNDQAVFDYALKKRSELYDLIIGYCEMAELNEEICHEFLSCESDFSKF